MELVKPQDKVQLSHITKLSIYRSLEHSISLINNLEIKFFKNKDIEKGTGITDFINKIIQIVKRELDQFSISIQDMGLIEPVEL